LTHIIKKTTVKSKKLKTYYLNIEQSIPGNNKINGENLILPTISNNPNLEHIQFGSMSSVEDNFFMDFYHLMKKSLKNLKTIKFITTDIVIEEYFLDLSDYDVEVFELKVIHKHRSIKKQGWNHLFGSLIGCKNLKKFVLGNLGNEISNDELGAPFYGMVNYLLTKRKDSLESVAIEPYPCSPFTSFDITTTISKIKNLKKATLGLSHNFKNRLK